MKYSEIGFETNRRIVGCLIELDESHAGKSLTKTPSHVWYSKSINKKLGYVDAEAIVSGSKY